MSAFDASCFEPKTATEVFKRGVAECLREGWSAWLTAFAILLAPTALALAGQYLTWRTGAAEFLMTMQKGAVNPQNLDMGELFGAIALVAGVGLVTGLLSVLASYASGVAVTRLMAERALGRQYGPAQAWDFVLGRVGKIVGGGLVLMLVLAGAAIVGEIPGGIIGAVIGMSHGPLVPGASPPPIMQIAPIVTMLPVLLAAGVYLAAMMAVTGVENHGGFTALKRSFRLASGHFKHVLGAVALAGLAFVAPSMAVAMLGQTAVAAHLRETLGAANGMLALTGVSSILSLLLSPFALTVQAAIYFDLRSRQREETFTAYELALDVGGELPAGVAAPAEPADWAPPPVPGPAADAPPPPDIS
jgi:hypothetical protein